MADPNDPDPAGSEDEFESQVRDRAHDLLTAESVVDEVVESESMPDDGEPADAIEPDGTRWRVKVTIVAKRHQLV